MAKNRDDMSAADTAQRWANELVRRESRGPGDMENAMRRLEARYGIPWRTFWSLRYRKPSDVMVSVYLKLHDAYAAECLRQERLLQHEFEVARLKMAAFEDLDSPQADLAGGEDITGG